jgi:tripartite-type tricarboxylate transporter receptor subunit TctC
MFRIVMLALVALAFAPQAWADDAYPSRPIHIIVGYPPGSSDDVGARVLANQLETQAKWQVVVENRPGATATIAAAYVAKAAPDGYTLLFSNAGLPSAGLLYKSLTYDLVKDFVPITEMWRSPQVLVVSNALPVKTLQEFIAYVKANPGRLNYGSSGTGSLGHLGSELFLRSIDGQVTHVPYKGGGEVITAVISNQVQMVLSGVSLLLPQIKSGKVRALAVTSEKRSPMLPDVPSFAESGLAKVSYTNWFGLAAPAGTPKKVVDAIRSATLHALDAQATKDALAAQGAEVTGSTPEQFDALIRKDVQQWDAIIRAAGITAQ